VEGWVNGRQNVLLGKRPVGTIVLKHRLRLSKSKIAMMVCCWNLSTGLPFRAPWMKLFITWDIVLHAMGKGMITLNPKVG